MFAIDCHDHIYHPRLARKAVEEVGKFYNVEMACSGTSEDLESISLKSPIKAFIINSVALTPRTVRRLNDYVSAQCAEHSCFFGLGTLHPDMDDPEAEIEHIIHSGLRGIKLHPDTQNFYADSEKAMRIYEMISGRLPLLIHSGDYRSDLSHPRRIANIIDSFPQLTVIAAHFGGWSIYDESVPYMTGRNCYMDISSSMPFIGRDRVFELIRRYGAQRLMFGSDYPMFDPVNEYRTFMEMPLSDEERELILYRNAASVFDIDVSAQE